MSDEIPVDVAAEPGGGPEAADSARLRAAYRSLSATEARLRRAEARLASLESSTALRVGRLLASAARRPARRLPRLPRDLYRLWRGRGVRPAPAPAPPPSTNAVYEEERLLTGGPARPASGMPVGSGGVARPLVAGVLTEAAAGALATVADVLPLMPHDAAQILARSEPDVIIVQASACTGGPWFGLGDPAATDLDTRLTEALRGTTAPHVLLADAPCPPSLTARPWHHVAAAAAGIDLRTFHPLPESAARVERHTEPLLVWPEDPRAPLAARRFRRDVLAAVATVDGSTAPHARRADLMRRHRAVLAGTADAVAEALACGAWVVAPEHAVPPDLRPHVAIATDADQAAKHLAAIDSPRPYAEVREALRAVFTNHSVPSRLATLLTAAHTPTTPDTPRHTVPPGERAVAGRRVAVPASGSAADVPRLGNRAVPVEVVAGTGLSRAELAAAADAPWVVYRDSGVTPDELADLVCAAEYGCADAVGYADRDTPGYVTGVTGLTAFIPVLARRELAASGAPAGTWFAQYGARLLALPAPDGERTE